MDGLPLLGLGPCYCALAAGAGAGLRCTCASTESPFAHSGPLPPTFRGGWSMPLRTICLEETRGAASQSSP